MSNSITPSHFRLGKEISKNDFAHDRINGNFILDIINDPNADPSVDSVIYVATGDGFSKGATTLEDLNNISWYNKYVGLGGSSAIAIDRDGNIWMTTATDSFIAGDGIDAFLSTGTGVHMSSDSGMTWNHYPQPGITPVQGLTYDIACDTLGGIWMACFGQSIQKLDSIGAEWKTVVCGEPEWDPIKYMNQRMFSVHHTGKGELWVGTADGINRCVDYSVPDSLKEWKHYTYRNGLTGNFVTAINSNIFSDGKEYVWIASWFADNAAEFNGVSFTDDNGSTWQTCLHEEKIYNIDFNGDDIYACGESGLWKSSDYGNYWEKYDISVYSEIKNDYVDISKVYSFEYQNGKMFIGTGYGLVVSEDEGNTWEIIEAYKSSTTSDKKTYAYPNPFSPERFIEQKIQFKLDKPEAVSCAIYSFAMEKVRDVVSQKEFSSGEHYISWDGKDNQGDEIANGVYFYIITFRDKKLWNKIIIFD